MKKHTLILLLTIISIQLLGQTVNLRAVLDTNVIGFADQTVLRLQVQSKMNTEIFFPEIKDTISDEVEIVEDLGIDTVSITPFVIEKSYLITSFEDSIRNIRSLLVIVNRDSLWTNKLKILVVPLDVDSTLIASLDTTQVIPIFDIKQPFDAPFTFQEFWLRFGKWILLGLGILLVIGIIIWIINRKLKNKPIVILEKPKEPAHIIAFRRLNELKKDEVFHQDNTKEYYSELTDIVRTYIEQRFRISALENTSTELLKSFDHTKLITNEQFDLLRLLLNTADMAKFAKYKPLQNTNEDNFDLAYKFVDTTKIKQQ